VFLAIEATDWELVRHCVREDPKLLRVPDIRRSCLNRALDAKQGVIACTEANVGPYKRLNYQSSQAWRIAYQAALRNVDRIISLFRD
jgi:hypothetical protein